MNDLGFFNSLKSRVWKEDYCSVEDMAAGIPLLFAEYNAETLERVWRSLFRRYNQVLRGFGGNDFQVERRGG